jgi:hypothetical protein
MELHKSYIALGLIIAFVLFFGIAARAAEPARNLKPTLLTQRPAIPLLSFAAERNSSGTRN